MSPEPTIIERATSLSLRALRDQLAAQPSERWNADVRSYPREGGSEATHCAIGHLELALDVGLFSLKSDHPVFDLFKPLITDETMHHRADWALAEVNNGFDPRYRQPDPRARTLAAIDDLLAGTVPPLPTLPTEA